MSYRWLWESPRVAERWGLVPSAAVRDRGCSLVPAETYFTLCPAALSAYHLPPNCVTPT
jgi:hypothetical protein